MPNLLLAPSVKPRSRAIPDPAGVRAPFLVLSLFLPVAIVISNFIIADFTPITLMPDDDMSLVDPVWRFVQGQHLGSDFHDPHGFGLPKVAAILWHLFGPHYYVLRASATFFALLIALCASIVAMRQLRHAPGLAALFCIMVAMEASGPSIYGFTDQFGMALSYDRLMVGCLLVLFVHSFAKCPLPERDYIDHFTTAFLLNILFLIKISGFILGLGILAGGCIVRGSLSRNLVHIFLVSVFLATMVAIDFIIAGAEFSPVIHEYALAAQARTGSYSVFAPLRFAFHSPLLGVTLLMVLYAASQPGKMETVNLWRYLLVIVFFWGSQVVINMTNDTHGTLILFAPAAAVALVTWPGESNAAAFWRRPWNVLHFRKLQEISARDIIPLLILSVVFVPEVLAPLKALRLDYAIRWGRTAALPIAVTANRGMTFEILPTNYSQDSDVYTTNRAVKAIELLDASHETIANVAFMNPFPALFLAPAPRGVSVWWDFGFNVPIGYRPSWQDIIGNACIVTEPKHPLTPGISKPLIEATQPHLASAFTLVYQDESWKIWKRNGGCGSAGGAGPGPTQ
jgi:hypothetical protein